MNSAAPMETIKALTGMAYATAAVGNSVTPSTRPMAAPKLAAADRPSVKGLASGLFRTVCICTPATARLAPTTSADRATGRRNSQKMTCTAKGASGRHKAASTCPGG